MALTTDQVINSSDYLDDVTRQTFIILFRSNDIYKQNAISWSSDVATRLNNASGTVKGRMLNALMKKIDKLGTGVASIRADKDGLFWSQEAERNALVTEALYVLYDITDALDAGASPESIAYPDGGLFGGIAIGARDVCQCTGNYCCEFHANLRMTKWH